MKHTKIKHKTHKTETKSSYNKNRPWISPLLFLTSRFIFNFSTNFCFMDLEEAIFFSQKDALPSKLSAVLERPTKVQTTWNKFEWASPLFAPIFLKVFAKWLQGAQDYYTYIGGNETQKLQLPHPKQNCLRGILFRSQGLIFIALKTIKLGKAHCFKIWHI